MFKDLLPLIFIQAVIFIRRLAPHLTAYLPWLLFYGNTPTRPNSDSLFYCCKIL